MIRKTNCFIKKHIMLKLKTNMCTIIRIYSIIIFNTVNFIYCKSYLKHKIIILYTFKF